MAPSHYLNQFWLTISKVLWHSPEGNLTHPYLSLSLGCCLCPIRWSWQKFTKDFYPWYEFENCQFKITATSPRDQWVKARIKRLISRTSYDYTHESIQAQTWAVSQSSFSRSLGNRVTWVKLSKGLNKVKMTWVAYKQNKQSMTIQSWWRPI